MTASIVPVCSMTSRNVIAGVVVNEPVYIAPTAVLENCIIGPNTSVGDGAEIIYVPCHRSHMDYLLLSYVIYRKGFAVPHVAGGVNLNRLVLLHLHVLHLRPLLDGRDLMDRPRIGDQMVF